MFFRNTSETSILEVSSLEDTLCILGGTFDDHRFFLLQILLFEFFNSELIHVFAVYLIRAFEEVLGYLFFIESICLPIF
jgi:hypothetical protein